MQPWLMWDLLCDQVALISTWIQFQEYLLSSRVERSTVLGSGRIQSVFTTHRIFPQKFVV